jgi:hypothetical protein
MSTVGGGGHLAPFPAPCAWCGEPAYPDETCPATIPCPRCGAEPGERCRLPNGHATTLHRARRDRADALPLRDAC